MSQAAGKEVPPQHCTWEMCQQISKDHPAVPASSPFPSRDWADTLVPSTGESLQHNFKSQPFASTVR